MKKILFLASVGFLLIAGNAYSHCGKCGMGDGAGMDFNVVAEEKAGKMAKDLSLTDEQKSKVVPILLEKMQRKHSLMEATDKAMKDIHERYETKLKEVLNEEQLKKREKIKAQDHGSCPMCKDGKKCKKCEMMKGKEGKCHKCNDGKMCPKCQKMSEGKCPMCKDGKLCKKCKAQKAKEEKK